MKKTLNQIAKWALALLVSVPFVYSCDDTSGDTVAPGLEVMTNPMGPDAKSQFLHVQASGDWSITIEYPEDQPAEWASVTPSTGTGNKAVQLKVEYYAGVQARKASIVLTAGSKKAELVLTQNGRSGGGGNLNPSTGWMELPAMPNGSEFGYFTHSMVWNFKKTRNYSFSWDYKNLVAPWVAYPLCKEHSPTGGYRSEAWGIDPYLPEKLQPVLYNRGFSSSSGRYDRGHQIPSADRKATSNKDHYAANAQTFYGTNMTPQLNAFNTKIWANLEDKVRVWASGSDTCYVVTGCITKGSNAYASDNHGKKVTVPTKYYKAVLRYIRNSTIGHSGYSACAILLEHKGYGDNNNFKPYAMSVSDLEKVTGITYFANLPAKIGEDAAAKVKSEDPKTINWWWN